VATSMTSSDLVLQNTFEYCHFNQALLRFFYPLSVIHLHDCKAQAAGRRSAWAAGCGERPTAPGTAGTTSWRQPRPALPSSHHLRWTLCGLVWWLCFICMAVSGGCMAGFQPFRRTPLLQSAAAGRDHTGTAVCQKEADIHTAADECQRREGEYTNLQGH
jgi:hypothetical protein